MAESGLTAALTDLRTLAIEYLYGGSDPTDYAGLATPEQARIDRIINRALEQVYTPPLLPGDERPIEWTFLRPETTLSLDAPYSTGTVTVVNGVVTLASGTFPAGLSNDWTFRVSQNDYAITSRDSGTQITLEDLTLDVAAGTAYEVRHDDYTLGDDFGHILSPIYFAEADEADHPARQTSYQDIMVRRQRDAQSAEGSHPTLFAVRPKANDPTLGTRKVLMFWPGISQAATAIYRYRVRPDVLTTTNKYPWGASDHSALFRASVEAQCEIEDLGGQGPLWQVFLTRLAASAAFDARDNRPTHLGYNADHSDRGYGHPRRSQRHDLLELVTYNGS